MASAAFLRLSFLIKTCRGGGWARDAEARGRALSGGKGVREGEHV
jgi:hypothetical protein